MGNVNECAYFSSYNPYITLCLSCLATMIIFSRLRGLENNEGVSAVTYLSPSLLVFIYNIFNYFSQLFLINDFEQIFQYKYIF